MHRIFQTIEQYRMIEPGMKVIAAVSGGADSVCLLYVLEEYRKKADFELLTVHVEHGLRGRESLEDAAFTEELCRSLGVPCRVISADVGRAARERKLSVEEAGRMERYRIFRRILREWGGHRIAVAHNENDQAETVLWNLARGSGRRGLCGIRPVREEIIRPLLFTGRREIEEILTEAGLSWRTDRTNLEQTYTRNRIRLSILPEMEKELNAGAVRHIAEAAGKLRQVDAYVERRTDEAAARCLRMEGEPGKNLSAVIDLKRYDGEDEFLQRELLRRGLAAVKGSLQNVGTVHLEMLEALSGMDCGKSFCLPGGVLAVREQGILRLKRKPGGKAETEKDWAGDDFPELEIGDGGCFRAGRWTVKTELLRNTPGMTEEIKKENQYTKWLSYDTINNSMRFRTRRSGDYLVVNADGGRKKLKDYFIDQKIPREQRDRIPVFADGSHVLWVPGYRISEAAKVRQETRFVLKIQLKEET